MAKATFLNRVVDLGALLAPGVALAGVCGVSLLISGSVGLPPGAVALLLLLGWLMHQPGLEAGLNGLFDRVIGHVPVLFVPVGTGIATVRFGAVIEVVSILVALLLGTVATMAVVGWVVQAVRSLGGTRSLPSRPVGG
jgi:putative effector of murein hydrolase LrgA (UPF0299 family)